jgi:general secretion pathway protein E
MTPRLPFGFARTHRVLVAGGDTGRVTLWVTERTPVHAIAEVRRGVESAVEPVLVPEERFETALRAAYLNGTDQAATVVGEVESETDLQRLMQDIPEVEDLLDARDDAPVIRMLNALLSQALREGASDIHVEPYESHSVVRFRVDGTLRDIVHPGRGLHGALVSRIKIMANLDIAEKRLPQDGRITLRLGGGPIECACRRCPRVAGSARCCGCSTRSTAASCPRRSAWRPTPAPLWSGSRGRATA